MLTASSTHPPEGNETSIIVYKFENSFSEKKLENLKIKSLVYFKYQFSIIIVTLSCGSFFH